MVDSSLPANTTTTCPYCGVGCGVRITCEEGETRVTGDDAHPANFGRLCSKGLALGETLSLDDRLLYPQIEGRQVDWNAALRIVADRFNETITTHGRDSVAFYVSGQLLTEDYYVANKLMKGFIGANNIDTNSRLCMASSVAGHKRSFGTDTVPGCYDDLELADLVVLTGSNLAWCHPVLYQRLYTAKAKRPHMKVIVIDPRRTATCEIADLHLALKPGSDVALFNGLLTYLDNSGCFDQTFVAQHTTGLRQCLDTARGFTLGGVVEATGLAPDVITRFFNLFAATEKVVTVYSQGVNQSSCGTNKVNAIINCHLATGRIGKPGMSPLSITGQPNAMGGREVGGLANQLAAHMEIENPEHRDIVREFWKSPEISSQPGLKAVELFEAVHDGRIKAMWIMGTNPADSMPEADRVQAALAKCPFLVVSDVARETDTCRFADALLPAAAWGEKDGTVTNSERRISRQRGFLDLPGETRPDWWIICETAKRMGFMRAFDYAGPHEIFDEHARLSTYRNNGSRDFDIGALTGLDRNKYNTLTPVQWPYREDQSKGQGTNRLFSEGGFFTPTTRARFVSTPTAELASQTSPQHPYRLNTGRIRDQWHTMTRTAKSARLMAHMSEPFVAIHPSDAAKSNLNAAELAIVSSDHGAITARVLIDDGQKPGSVFVPMHWTDQIANAARVGALITSHTDPVSGQPELKAMPVGLKPLSPAWYGFAVTCAHPRPRAVVNDYWALARANHGWRLEIAGCAKPDDWHEFANELLLGETECEQLAYEDAASGQFRLAYFNGERLIGALYIAQQPVAVSRNWAVTQLKNDWSDVGQRLALLAGRAGDKEVDPGAIVCSCFEVGSNQIATVVADGCCSVEAVGEELGAGTNCGSCRSQIQRIVEQYTPANAA